MNSSIHPSQVVPSVSGKKSNWFREKWVSLHTAMKLKETQAKTEITSVYLAVNIPSFLLTVYFDYTIWIPGTLALYGLAASYPFLLKAAFKNRINLARQKEREAFALTEFGAGVPAVLAAYGAFNWASHGAIDNHVLATSVTWAAGRAVGVPTWILLHKINNSELYRKTGWKTGSVWNSLFCGIRMEFSSMRQGAVNEIMELWAYGRRMDWHILLACYPLLMLGVISMGFTGKNAFAIHGTLKEVLTEAYYAFYFNPRFYDRMNAILAAKQESE